MESHNIDKLTERIIGCAFKVSNSLGIGFVEKVYENAYVHELRQDGLSVQQQFPIKVVYDGIIVGDFYADMLVEETILIELKAVTTLDKNHIAQSLNYLRASGLETCLLINFGTPKIQIRNLKPSPKWKSS